MTERHWLWVTVAAVIAAVGGAGCDGDSFAPTSGDGGSGAATTTNGGGGQGGATASTTAGGAGGEGGGTAGAGGGVTTTSTSTGEGGAGGGPVCQPISDPCAQCAYGACEDQYCACYASADCAALIDCFQDCPMGDAACQQDCMSQHGASISTAFLLGECTAQPCADECPGVGTVGECEHCLFTSCADQMNACLADVECYAILMCGIQCPADDPNNPQMDCVFDCLDLGMAPAKSKAFQVLGCLQQNCESLCL